MFKFLITKAFDRSEPEKAQVQFSVKPPKLPEEIFNDAVRQVVRDKLRVDLEQQLIEMCYTPEQVADSKYAIRKFGRVFYTTKELDKVQATYPNAVIVPVGGAIAYKVHLEFTKEKFIDGLLGKVGGLE